MITYWFEKVEAVLNGRRLCLALLFALCLTLLPLWPKQASAVGDIYRVKPIASGAANGSSWDDAATLQWALGDAEEGDEIWVAAGTYVPGDNESDSFDLVPGVAVYGGFAGTEAAREERDWRANLTILSGDIDGDDENKVDDVVMDAADIVGGNIDHVVTADGTTGTIIQAGTILDGFTITAGQADGVELAEYGGGLLCDGGVPYDGGVHYSECSPSLINLSFSGNAAGIGGGAILNNGAGGGGSPSLINVSFTGNSAGYYGGAMHNSSGGGSSSPSLTNVSFSGNSAGQLGGAMYNDGYGGSSSPSLTNISFSGNSAGEYGGAMFNMDGGDFSGISIPVLTNVIMWGNSATNGGSEIFSLSVDPTINYSLIKGENPAGAGNLDGTDPANNPLFVDEANGDLRLQLGSPAIDAGDNSAPSLSGILTDLDGKPRIFDGDGDGEATVDMGAYEFVPSGYGFSSLYVPAVFCYR